MSKKTPRKLALLRLATFPLASVVWIARPANADTYCFVSGEGTTWDNTSTLPWYDQTNPLSVAFPPNNGTASAVLGNFGIAQYITSNTNVTFNYTYTTGINYLEIDSGNTLTQSSSGTAMVCYTEVLGDDGGATYTQSAGSNTINGANNFNLGFDSGESSTYNLSGTGQFVDTGSGYGEVGYSGNGTFNQTGGTASVTYELDLGRLANSVGAYNLSNTTGTGSLTVGTMVLGYQGSGTFTQASGTNQTGTLILADLSGSSGAYNLQGGTLKATSVTVNANGNFDQTGGTMTFTTFNQNAGTVSLSAGLNLASSTYALSGGSLSTSSITGTASNLKWSSGSLTLTNQPFDVSTVPDTAYNGFVDGSSLTLSSGMSLTVSAAASEPWEYLFGSGSTITQNTGSTNTTPYLYMGASGAGASAVQYNLTGGTLKVNNPYIGFVDPYTGSGSAALTQSGGTASFGTLYLGYFTGPGTYSLSAGTMSVSGSINLYSGSTFHQSGGTLSFGSFNESGGTANFDTGLNLTSSTVNLSGGSLTTSSITGTASNLNWTSGSLTLTNQPFDVSTVSDTSYGGFVIGSSFTLNSGMSLNVPFNGGNSGDEFVFGSGSTFTQNTGSSNTMNLLYMGATGSGATAPQYNLNGGTLNIVNAYIGYAIYSGSGAAGFTQTGGTATFANLSVSPTGPATYSLSAGTMSVSGSISLYSGSTFHQSGGVLTSPSTFNAATMTQTGGTASLGALSGTGTVALGGGTSTASMTVSKFTQGSITVSNLGLFSVSPNSGFANSVSSLSITGSGQFDLANNHMFINYGSGPDPIASIAAWIKSGYSGGTWNGAGIISTTGQYAVSYGIGYADSADPGNPAGLSSGQIEIMYTLYGDANLDGKVNGTDFTLMAANFNDSVTHGWDKGDFNYSGTVNGDDFVLLAENFNQFASQSDVSAADLSALDSFAAANGISLANVPEPATIAVVALSAGAFLTRRRRQD